MFVIHHYAVWSLYVPIRQHKSCRQDWNTGWDPKFEFVLSKLPGTPSRSCGLMDKAPDFGSGDCRLESCHGLGNTFCTLVSPSHAKYFTVIFRLPQGNIQCQGYICFVQNWNKYFFKLNMANQSDRETNPTQGRWRNHCLQRCQSNFGILKQDIHDIWWFYKIMVMVIGELGVIATKHLLATSA